MNVNPSTLSLAELYQLAQGDPSYQQLLAVESRARTQRRFRSPYPRTQRRENRIQNPDGIPRSVVYPERVLVAVENDDPDYLRMWIPDEREVDDIVFLATLLDKRRLLDATARCCPDIFRRASGEAIRRLRYENQQPNPIVQSFHPSRETIKADRRLFEEYLDSI